MSIPELFRKNRVESELTIEQVADRLGVPEFVVKFIEEPTAANSELEEVLSQALGISTGEFRGEVRRPTKDERQDARATYPQVRQFVIDRTRCENPEVARELFGDQPLSLPEHNLLLYMSTNALYLFCESNTSAFAFDEYLFKLHSALLARLERHLDSSSIPEAEKEERRTAGRANVFACESIENIAVLVFDSFAAELEKKLADGQKGWEAEAGLPFTWRVDRELMQIEICGPKGDVKDTLRLLDVKTRRQT